MRERERLAGQRQAQAALEGEVAALTAQGNAIRDLLLGRQLNACIVDRAALYAVQQRQAVLRQQKYLLEFECDRLRERIETLVQQQCGTKANIQRLQRKQHKFEKWADLQKRERMLVRLRQEESENEERGTRRL